MADPNTAKSGAAAVTEAVPVGAVEQLFRFMEDGGPILYLLLVISVVALTLIIAKLIQFWMLKVHAHRFVEPALRSWHDGQIGEALGILSGERNPAGAHIGAESSQRSAQIHESSPDRRGGKPRQGFPAGLCNPPMK